MSKSILVAPIGRVSSARSDPIDDGWDGVESKVILDAAAFDPEATLGLDAFSHIEVIYQFDRVPDEEMQKGARHPRGRTDWPKIGILAQRGKGRPNRIGVTVCRLKKVDGLTLYVEGLDAIDGTPVVDIKPVMKGFLPRGEFREPAWAAELMKGYWSDQSE